MESLFSSSLRNSRLLLPLLLATHTTASLFPTGSSPAIQDPLTNPPPTICPVFQNGITSDTFPWSYNPTCIHAVLPSSEDSGHIGIRQDFCVFTNTAFNSGRGISLVTTPEIAAALAGEVFSPYFEDPTAQKGAWEVKETEGKGKGVYVKKGVEAGETVLLRSPALVVSKELMATPSRQRKQLLLKKAVEQLPEETRELIMGLSGKQAEGEIEDLIDSNAIRAQVWEGTSHLIVVPEAGRVNHACRPNAYYRFDDYTLDLDIFALRDIQPGEELTFSYGFSHLPKDERILALRESFGFKCTCPLCSANSTTTTASDTRLLQISQIKSALPTDPSALPQLLGLLPNLVSLLEEEGLVSGLAMYEEILGYAWSSFGIEDRARYWAGRARRHWNIIVGKGSAEVKRTSQLEDDVKGHYTWRSWDGEDPWEGVGVGHPWGEDDHEHDHDHDHSSHAEHHEHNHEHTHGHGHDHKH